jgi:hypothetical protein
VNEPGLITLFVAPLHRAGIPYVVTGGVASVIYGEPRLTRDIDLVLAPTCATPSDLPRCGHRTRSTHRRSR